MIMQLTEKQRELLSVYKNKWVKIGLNTDRIDRESSIETINSIYKHILKKDLPKKILFFKSPYSTWIAINCYYMFKYALKSYVLKKKNNWNEVWNEVRNEVENEVENEVWNEVENEVRNEVENEVENEVWNEVENEVRNEVENEVWNEVENEVRNEVENEVWNEVENEVWNEVLNEVRNEVEKNRKLLNFIYPYLDGSFMASWCAFYDYMQEVLELQFSNKYSIFKEVSKLNLIYPLKNICFCSEKPTIINKKDGKLHCDDGPALKYEDGFELWRLYGVKVDKSIVLTKAEDLDPELILTETNAEVRKEVIRKIGIDRCIEKLGADVIEGNGVYQLLNFSIHDTKRPYLKMLNPSTGNYHVEGVHPNCNTIEKALAWRNYEWDGESDFKGYTEPIILT